GAWINLVNPSQEESVRLSEQFNIDITDLRAALDLEETSRIAVEDNYTLIIVDVPTYEERNNKSYYVTIPLGIIVTENAVITTCLQELTQIGRASCRERVYMVERGVIGESNVGEEPRGRLLAQAREASVQCT